MVPVALVICQCLQAQIAHPQAAIPLGAVLKHQLHAVVQGLAGHCVDLPEKCVFRLIGKQRRLVGGGDRLAVRALHHEIIFTGDIQYFKLHIAKSVTPLEAHFTGQHIHMDLLLLHPGCADPAVVILHVFRKLLLPLSKFQPQPGRRVRVTADKGEPDRHRADQVLAKVQR